MWTQKLYGLSKHTVESWLIGVHEKPTSLRVEENLLTFDYKYDIHPSATMHENILNIVQKNWLWNLKCICIGRG
jgi:hypothetical protein